MTTIPTDFYCIYLGERRPVAERSKEHIYPWALGGCDDFITWDTSFEGNSKAGTQVDSRLINNWFITSERWRLKIKANSGKIPPILMKGTIDLDGKTVSATYSVSADLKIDLVQIPQVSCDWETGKIAINCGPGEIKGILDNIGKKAQKKGLQIDKDKILDDATKAMRTIANPQMLAEFSVGEFDLLPCFLKMALGTGHKVLGERWTSGPQAGQIRQMMWETNEGNYPNYKIHGGVWPVYDTKALRQTMSAGDDCTVLAILNTNPVSFYASFFGKYDGMVQLADGVWTGSPDAPPGVGVIFLFDLRSRKMTKMTLTEFIGKKQRGLIP